MSGVGFLFGNLNRQFLGYFDPEHIFKTTKIDSFRDDQTSFFVSADVSVRSTRKLCITIITKYFYCIKVSQK